MPLPFSLSVPLDPDYRVLAPDIAAKYAELLGGGPNDAEGLAVDVRGERILSAGLCPSHFACPQSL